VKGPKITPRDITPRLGKIIKGRYNLFGKKIAPKNKQVLTVVPISHCGWLKEKGITKDKKEKITKTKIRVRAIDSTGKLNGKIF